MAFDDHAPAQPAQPAKPKERSSTDDMVLLGQMAAKGIKPPTKAKSYDFPREAKIAIGVALAVIIGLVLLLVNSRPHG